MAIPCCNSGPDRLSGCAFPIAQTNAAEITEPDLGSTSINYYYKVRSLDGCEPSNSSYVQRVGEFDFSLTPGSN